MKARASRGMSRNCRRFKIRWRVYRPLFNAFWLPRGAPLPVAPPCMRQRFLPATAGDMRGLPERVFAPQRGPSLTSVRYYDDTQPLDF